VNGVDACSTSEARPVGMAAGHGVSVLPRYTAGSHLGLRLVALADEVAG